jgi:Family of unknown function (DUF6263)
MMLQRLIDGRIFGVCLSCFAIFGCGQSQPETAALNDEQMLAELLGSDAFLTEHDADELPVETRPDDTRRERLRRAADPEESRAVGERLELRLRKGDRFPLFKTIEQSLVQKSDTLPARAMTRLELSLAISVDDVREDAMLLSVIYSRVAYQHDVNGQQLVYDSDRHQGHVPFDAIPYAGMVRNGFSFWLGRDNSIREMVGYQEFLQACVRDVPLERRQGMLAEISSRFGDDGVANFIDDSIGLLPYDSTVDPEAATRVLPGDVWTRERRLMQPIPTYLTSTYRLTELGRETAEIDITGRVAAGEAVNGSDDARLKITGGHSMGRCIIDRATGLPVEMNLTRNITMTLTTADNQKVVQEKQIVTMIRTFPETRGSVVEHQPDSRIRPASGERLNNRAAQQIPTTATPGAAVQAVYPD